LTSIDLTNATKNFGYAFGHVVGSLMHITTVSRPALAYCVVRYLGYMAKSLQTHWKTGFVEYLPGDYGEGLATYADANFAHCLYTCNSVSAHFHLLNGVLVFLGL